MLKDFSEYQKLAGVTRKLNDPTVLEYVHYALGMVGEAGEVAGLGKVSEDEWIKELGDCFWYAAGICSVMELDFEDVVTNQTRYTQNVKGSPVYVTVIPRLLSAAAGICEIAKKAQFYDRPILAADTLLALSEYVLCLLFLCQTQGFDPLVVCDKNIKKLQARFGGKFDAALAQNRDLAAEHAAVKS